MAVLIALLSGLVFPVGAAGKFKVFPTVIDLERAPGTPSIGTFNVTLKGEHGHDFEVVVKDVVQHPDGSFAFVEPSRSPYSASSWLSVSPQRFDGAPDRTQPVQYQVLVPDGAEPGDHITSLLVERLPKDREATTVPIEAISVRLDVLVSGKAVPAAEITSLSAPKIAGGSPVNLSASISNTGNVTLDFDHANKGSLAVTSGSDRKADVGFSGVLYPDQSRVLDLSWNDAPLFGSYSAEASVDLGQRVVRRSQSFYVVPWRQIGALLLVALAAVVLLAGVRRRRARGY
jgi:hypothetical protein